MKHSFIIALIFAFLLHIGNAHATCSPFTVSMTTGGSGQNATAFTADGELGTDNSCTYFLQWDASYLYVGWSGGNTNYSSDMYYAAINLGSGGTTGAVQGVGFSDPMDYYLVYENNSSFYGAPASNGNAYEIYNGTSGSWSFSSRYDNPNNGTEGQVHFAAGGEVRLRIPWSSLGGSLPATFQIVMWTNNSSGNYIWSSWPASNPVGSTSQTLTHGVTFSTAGTVCPASAQAVKSLPIELVDFTAKKLNNSTELAWSTSSERNNSHFEIERSADGRNWSNIGEVKGNDTQERVNNYTFRDERPLSGMNYYRLKQVDFNGNYEYSRAVSVRFSDRTLGLSVSPNPATDRLTIQGINTENGILEVVDPSGVVMMTVRNATAINVGTLAPGTYVLRYQSEDGETSQCRFVKK